MPSYTSQADLLNALKRANWQVVGRTPHLIDVTRTNRSGEIEHVKEPAPGQYDWSIIGPDGDPDTITVQESGGEGDTYSFTLIEGPKKNITTPKPDKPGWTNPFWARQDNGSQIRMGTNPATGQVEPMPGPDGQPITQSAQPSTAGAPHIEWQPRQLPNGDWVEDPVQWDAANNQWKPAPGLTPRPAKSPRGEPAKPAAPTIREIDGKEYVWIPDANSPAGGRLELAPGVPPDAPHPDREFVDNNGMQVHQTWNAAEKKYVTDPSVPPVPWTPAAKAAAAKTEAQPKEGDTRPNINSAGYNVTETYRGGEWTTTGVGSRATPMTPTTITTASDQPYVLRTDEQGKEVWVPNQNYMGPKAPTTRGEIAQRVAQLQSQMQQMRDKIQADKTIPPDQQTARFNQWYDQNITPQLGALSQQQQAIITDEAQKALEVQQKNLTAAANAIQSTAPYRVGPGYGQAFEKIVQATARGERAPDIDFSNVASYRAPSIDEHVQNLLAGRATTPAPPGMDLQAMLGRNQWMPGGAPPPAAAAAGAPPAAPGPLPTPTLPPSLPAGPSGAATNQVPGQNYGYDYNTAQLNGPRWPNPQPLPPDAAVAVSTTPSPNWRPPGVPPMPMATGEGPLAYNPGAFSGVMPLLPGFDYSQVASQYTWPS